MFIHFFSMKNTQSCLLLSKFEDSGYEDDTGKKDGTWC